MQEVKTARLPTSIPAWIPNHGESINREFSDGERFVVAVSWVNESKATSGWDIDVIRVMAYDDDGIILVYDQSGESYDKWAWGDVEYYIELERE